MVEGLNGSMCPAKEDDAEFHKKFKESVTNKKAKPSLDVSLLKAMMRMI